MSDNYLTESDFEFQNDNSSLEEKVENIINYTNSMLLDLSDEDMAVIKDIEEVFNLLKDSLFANSDTILRSKTLGFSSDERAKLDDVQALLLSKWKEFGFTEGFFHRYYQTQRQLKNAELDTKQNERIKLLLQALNEQKMLVIAFNVMASKENNPIILDVQDYM